MFERRNVVLPETLARACNVALSEDANKLLEFTARACGLNFVHEGLSFQGSLIWRLLIPSLKEPPGRETYWLNCRLFAGFQAECRFFTRLGGRTHC
jgi:hypothetical protein